MLSLLGSLLGFGTSFLPKIMDYFQDKQDKKHELAMQRELRETQIALAGAKLQALNVEADIRQSEALLRHDSQLQRQASRWVVNWGW